MKVKLSLSLEEARMLSDAAGQMSDDYSEGECEKAGITKPQAQAFLSAFRKLNLAIRDASGAKEKKG